MKLGQREDIGFGLFVDVVVFNKQVHFLTFGTEREILSLGFDFKAGPKIMWLRPNFSTGSSQRCLLGTMNPKGVGLVGPTRVRAFCVILKGAGGGEFTRDRNKSKVNTL